MSIEVKRTPIFSDPDLEAEHSALHTMACIIAQKWMLDLEHKDCSFSYDGLKWFYEDEMGGDFASVGEGEIAKLLKEFSA